MVSHSGGETYGAALHLMIFRKLPIKTNSTHGAFPPLKNETPQLKKNPPLKSETPFHEMIPKKAQ